MIELLMKLNLYIFATINYFAASHGVSLNPSRFLCEGVTNSSTVLTFSKGFHDDYHGKIFAPDIGFLSENYFFMSSDNDVEISETKEIFTVTGHGANNDGAFKFIARFHKAITTNNRSFASIVLHNEVSDEILMRESFICERD